MLGSQDLFVLLAIGVFFFGAKRLPELSRSLGQAISEFKKGVTKGMPDADGGTETAKAPATLPPAKDEGREGG